MIYYTLIILHMLYHIILYYNILYYIVLCYRVGPVRPVSLPRSFIRRARPAASSESCSLRRPAEELLVSDPFQTEDKVPGMRMVAHYPIRRQRVFQAFTIPGAEQLQTLSSLGL